MNLLEAQVYVNLDRHVALHLGEQTLYLPWNDLRARHVAHFHGERVVIGVRAEALTPVTPDTEGDVLHGRVRYLEHHGHESLAFLDIGAAAVVVDEMGGQAPADAGAQSGLRKLVSKLRRGNGAGDERERELVAAGRGGGGYADQAARRAQPNNHPHPRVFNDAGRHHRRPAELAVRLAPYPAVGYGHPLTVQIRMDALHFFDDRGKRIDVGWR
jgi:multiple sugar transport system ATP-binding protein